MSYFINDYENMATVSLFLNPTSNETALGDYFTEMDAGVLLNNFWGSWKLPCENNKPSVMNLFNLYAKDHKENYLKMLSTLSMEYNPIENYNRVEDTTITDNYGEKTREIGKQDFTNGEVKTDLSTGAQTISNNNKHSVNPYDSSSYYENEKDEQTQTIGARTDSNTVRQHINSTGARTDKDNTYKDTHTTVSNVSGNIGVTTTQQMITSELELRKTSIIFEYYKNFVEKYAFFIDFD